MLLLLSACQPSVTQDQTVSDVAASAAASGSAASEPAAMTTSEATASTATTSAATTSAAAMAQPAVLSAKILERYPHDTGAFTEGLQFVGKRFLESTGLVGQSGVRWVDPETGETEEQAATPTASAFGEGVTWLNGQIYHLTWQTGEAYRFDEALGLQETYHYTGEGWGLTNNGQELIMSNGSPTLFFRDPRTFAVTHEITVTDGGQPVSQLNELEWADGAIWANVWMQNRIARIDPQTGQVTGWLDVAPLAAEAAVAAASLGQQLTADDVPNGIAYNKKTGHFYLTGKRWPMVFEVQLSK